MPVTINDKIAHLIKTLGLNENSFAEEIGLSATAVYHVTGKRQSKPGAEFIQKIKSRYPDVDLNPLFQEDDNVDFFPGVTAGEQVVPFGASPGKIPVISMRAAANSLMGIQNNERVEVNSFIELPKEIIGSGIIIAVQVRGVSMSPVILDGSLAIIRMLERPEWREFRNGWIHLVYTEAYGAQIKYLRRSERNPSFIVLESENPTEETLTIEASEILGLWEWRGSLNLKFISLKKTLYDRIDKLEAAYFDLQTQISNQATSKFKQIS
jgi:SOS-response transcriptional repressor LexA